ncbi:DUF1841 domain containing protein [Pyrenophora teres f. maculata]|nr:DUF1841 domain containing protein [Pyrenophora teres f. maculata]
MAGRRDPELLSKFRSMIIARYGLQDPTCIDYIWDIFSNGYMLRSRHKTTQLFSWKHTQSTMTAIFGPEASQDLFSASNGHPVTFEDEMESGIVVIVPDINDPTSKTEVASWQSQDPREYKIRIFDNGQPEMGHAPIDSHYTGGVYIKLRDLNDWKLKFQTNSRPTERYLFFRYCCHILRRVWHTTDYNTAIPKAQLLTCLWGATGKYVPHDQMRVFVQELGPEYEPLIENSDAALDGQADPYTLLHAIAEQISIGNKRRRDKQEYVDEKTDEYEDVDEESEDLEDSDEDFLPF